MFAEHGGTFPFKGAGEPVEPDDFLTSAGLGVMWDLSDRISGRVSLGFPLTDNDHETDPRMPFVHFFVQLDLY